MHRTSAALVNISWIFELTLGAKSAMLGQKGPLGGPIVRTCCNKQPIVNHLRILADTLPDLDPRRVQLRKTGRFCATRKQITLVVSLLNTRINARKPIARTLH